MIWIIALLIAAGGGYLGWTLGLLLFAALFELARLGDLHAPLNSPDALQSVRAVSAAVCLAAGLRYVRPWHPEGDGLVGPKPARTTVLLASLGGIGGATLGHMVGTELATAAYAVFEASGLDPKTAYIWLILSTALVGFLLGPLLVARRIEPQGSDIYARATLAFAIAGAVLFNCVALSKRLEFRYERLGERPATELRTR